MKQYDYVIVGGGLFGGTFAYAASKSGKKCLVLEKRPYLGGNIYCEQIADINVHKYGAHTFHTSNRKVWEFVNSLAGFNRYTHSPVANYHGEIYNLPFNMNTFHEMWEDVRTPEEAKARIGEQRARITGQPQNLEEQAISLVGEDIYRKLVKGYTEKQWGHDCRELPAFIINRLPVRYCYDNNYFDDLYQGIPIGGYNVLIEAMFAGCDIELEADYNLDRERYNELGDRILYTGTLDSFYDYRFGKLEYRSLRFDTEVLDQENYQGVAVVNFTDRETPYTRIIEHKHFEFGSQEQTVITREYPVEWQEGMEPYYPVNDEKNQVLYQRYLQLTKMEEKVIFGGRLAEYRYYDMDQVIESAFSLIEKELNCEMNYGKEYKSQYYYASV